MAAAQLSILVPSQRPVLSFFAILDPLCAELPITAWVMLLGDAVRWLDRILAGAVLRLSATLDSVFRSPAACLRPLLSLPITAAIDEARHELRAAVRRLYLDAPDPPVHTARLVARARPAQSKKGEASTTRGSETDRVIGTGADKGLVKVGEVFGRSCGGDVGQGSGVCTVWAYAPYGPRVEEDPGGCTAFFFFFVFFFFFLDPRYSGP